MCSRKIPHEILERAFDITLVLSHKEVEDIEERQKSMGITRRLSLALLTKEFESFQDLFKREPGEMLTDLCEMIDEYLINLNNIKYLMELTRKKACLAFYQEISKANTLDNQSQCELEELINSTKFSIH